MQILLKILQNSTPDFPGKFSGKFLKSHFFKHLIQGRKSTLTKNPEACPVEPYGDVKST